MLKSYEAILDHGHVSWINDSPSDEKTRILVTILPKKIVEKHIELNGTKLARFAKSNPISNIEEIFGDPAEWQREQRKDRPLAGRI
jgi:hypothetical protein